MDMHFKNIPNGKKKGVCLCMCVCLYVFVCMYVYSCVCTHMLHIVSQVCCYFAHHFWWHRVPGSMLPSVPGEAPFLPYSCGSYIVPAPRQWHRACSLQGRIYCNLSSNFQVKGYSEKWTIRWRKRKRFTHESVDSFTLCWINFSMPSVGYSRFTLKKTTTTTMLMATSDKPWHQWLTTIKNIYFLLLSQSDNWWVRRLLLLIAIPGTCGI